MKNIVFPMIDSKWVFIAALIFWSVVGALYLRPASYWFEVDNVAISNSQVGKPINMLVSRKVHKTFLGEWQVVVKRRSLAGWVTFCEAGSSFRYQPERDLPDQLDLDWWTNGQCQQPTVGSYVAETSWKFDPGFFPREYVVTKTSNIFEITK